MSRVSRKSDLSPSATRASSSGIDLGKNSGVDMGKKSQPSISSGGIGVTQEVGNIGGMSVRGGVSVDISPVNFGISADPSEGSISVGGGAEIPGGLLGVSGGVTIDTNTGQVIGGSIGGEIGGFGINVSNSIEGGLGIEFTVQIPGTPIELGLGLGFPPKKEESTPTPSPTPEPEITPPGPSLENPLPYVPPPKIDPDCKYWIKTTVINKNNWDETGKVVASSTKDIETPDSEAKWAVPLDGFPLYSFPSVAIYQIHSAGTFYQVDKNNPYLNHIMFSSNCYQTTRLIGYPNRRSIGYGRNRIGYYSNGLPKYGEWIELGRGFEELKEVCEKKPSSPSPPFPHPPPRKRNMDECCRDTTKMLRAIYQRLGINKFPGQLPATIIQEVPKEGEQPAEPEQVPIQDFVDLLDWQFRRDDERWGQWKVEINVKDTDLTKDGNQEKQIKFPNLAESIAEIEGQILSLTANVDALVALQVKNLAESGMARQEAIKGYLAAKAIIKYMAFKSTETDVPIPMTFTAGAESISELLKESEGHIKGTDYVEKETLRDVYLDLLQAAAIIRAVHWQRIDTKTDTKSQLLSLLKGTVDLAGLVNNPQKSTDGQEKKFDPSEDFEDFLDAVEDGFRNAPGITDAQNPYGKSPDRRPRIRQIGNNISQAGGDN